MMAKKIIAILGIVGILSLFIAPVAQATTGHQIRDYCQLRYEYLYHEGLPDQQTFIEGTTVGASGSGATNEVEEWGLICTMDTITYVTNLIFNIVMIVSVLVVLIGAVMFMTARGNEDQVKQAKGWLLGALGGVAISLLAKIVPTLIRGIIGL